MNQCDVIRNTVAVVYWSFTANCAGFPCKRTVLGPGREAQYNYELCWISLVFLIL